MQSTLSGKMSLPFDATENYICIFESSAGEIRGHINDTTATSRIDLSIFGIATNARAMIKIKMKVCFVWQKLITM